MQATTPDHTDLQFLTLPEAARRTGVSIDTLRRHVKEGTLPGALTAGKYRIRVVDLDAWMAGRAA